MKSICLLSEKVASVAALRSYARRSIVAKERPSCAGCPVRNGPVFLSLSSFQYFFVHFALFFSWLRLKSAAFCACIVCLLLLSLSLGAGNAVAGTGFLGSMSGVRFKVAAEPEHAPFAFLEKSASHPVGFDVDIVYELQRRLGFELEENRFFPMSQEKGLQQLENKEVDMLIGGNALDHKLKERFDSSMILYQSGLSIMYTDPALGSGGIGVLKGKRVGVPSDSSAQEYLKGVLKLEATPFTNMIMAYYQLSIGKLDAIVAPRPELLFFARTMPEFNLKLTSDIFDSAQGNFVYYLTKDSPFTDNINAALRQMAADGTIQRLKKKWTLE